MQVAIACLVASDIFLFKMHNCTDYLLVIYVPAICAILSFISYHVSNFKANVRILVVKRGLYDALLRFYC